MYSVYDLSLYITFIFFVVAIFTSFFLPGFFIMNFIDRKANIRNMVLSYSIGFVLWSAQGFVFGFLHIRFMTYIYLLFFIFMSYKNLKNIKYLQLYLLQQVKRNKIITLIIIIGMVFQSLLMVGSGIKTPEGLRFLGSNNVDGIMHLGYIQSMITKFPPIEPGAYGLSLKNYHYWIDLNIAELSRIWKIPNILIFFQFLPPFISVITSVATFILLKIWTGSKKAGLFGLFFLYFGSDGAYLFMLYLHHHFGFYTPAIDNGITQFLNMPHASAKMIFTAGLIPFFYWVKTKEMRWGILAAFLFVSLIGFKIYFGIFAGLGLGLVVVGKILVAAYDIKKHKASLSFSQRIKKEYFSIILLLSFIIIAAIIYLPSNSGSGGLQYYPLEWPKLFLGQSNLDMREWWLRMQVYVAAGNIRNVIIYDSYAIFVTLICIHGTRIIGLLPTRKLSNLLGWEHMLFFIPGIIIFHILGLFTLQAAGSFNVFNFFVVSTVVMSFFSAYLMYDLMQKNKIWANVLIFLIIILSLPRAIYELYSVSGSIVKNNGALISSEELSALDYVRQNTPVDSVIQSNPNNFLDNKTPYVAYFANRQTYITGITMISSHGQKIDALQAELNRLFHIKDAKKFAELAKKNNIDYIYLQKKPEQKLLFAYNTDLFNKVYENESIIILKIKY